MTWNYAQPHSPSAVELAKELNGYALEDLYDPNGNLMYKKGQLLNGFAHLRMMGQQHQVTGYMLVNGLKKVTKPQTVTTLTHQA